MSFPKEKYASLSNINNYCGISLFNCINKLYDYVIIDLCGDRLVTSHMQYAYKPCHSTNVCTAVLKEIIDIYVRKKSNVYCCLLGASKAFDKVHYGKLFNVILSRDIHTCIVRIIVNSYIRQKACVSWGSYTTQYFDLSGHDVLAGPDIGQTQGTRVRLV